MMNVPAQAQPVLRKASSAKILSGGIVLSQVHISICDLCCAGVPLEICSRIRCACQDSAQAKVELSGRA